MNKLVNINVLLGIDLTMKFTVLLSICYCHDEKAKLAKLAWLTML